MTTRYSRQVVLPEVGSAGQALLGQARILVVGAGGLGSPALIYLAAAGIGRSAEGGCLGVIDDDHVDTSNLQRQIMYTEADQHRPKVVVAAERVQALNHEINVVTHAVRLKADNILALFANYDIIIDGSDNFATRYLVNDAAVKLGKPVVYGSILGFEGQITVFAAAGGPCYRCLYPEPSSSHIPNCAEAGTIGAIAGVIGSMQALEACKLALGHAHCRQHNLESLVGKLQVLDARNWESHRLAIEKNVDCPLCHQPPENIQIEPVSDQTCRTPDIPTITLSDLNDLYETGAPVMLVDVRESTEWASGHLNGAVHLPLGQLLTADEDIDLLDPDCLIVLYCQQGIRSLQAARHLASRGFHTLNLRVSL